MSASYIARVLCKKPIETNWALLPSSIANLGPLIGWGSEEIECPWWAGKPPAKHIPRSVVEDRHIAVLDEIVGIQRDRKKIHQALESLEVSAGQDWLLMLPDYLLRAGGYEPPSGSRVTVCALTSDPSEAVEKWTARRVRIYSDIYPLIAKYVALSVL